MCGDSQGPVQLHPYAKIYGNVFCAGGWSFNSGEKVGSVRYLSVMRSLVAMSGDSAVLPFANPESEVGNFFPGYHTILFLLAEHFLSYFNALGHESQRRLANAGYHDRNHHALGAGDVLDSPAVTVGHRDI